MRNLVLTISLLFLVGCNKNDTSNDIVPPKTTNPQNFVASEYLQKIGENGEVLDANTNWVLLLSICTNR